jgi:hypothetical protein
VIRMIKKWLTCLLALGAMGSFCSASGAEVEKNPFTCPVCRNQFEASALPEISFESQFSGDKSMDSDFCRHSKERSPLLDMVVTCPSCLFSAYAKEFSQPLREKHKTEVASMLKENPLPEFIKKDAVPPWLSWRYAGLCYAITRQDPLFVGQAFHGAAYAARIEATAAATAKLSIPGPESVLSLLEELEKQVAAEKDRQKRFELLMLVAQTAQRGGFVQHRDEAITQLEKETAGNAVAAQQVKAFTALVAAEEQCLEAALERYRTAMYDEKVPYRNRTLYNYLVADIMRRLGRRRSPVIAYYAHVVEDDDARPDMKKLAEYFIDYFNRM